MTKKLICVIICVSNDTLLSDGAIMDQKKYLNDSFFLFKNLSYEEINHFLTFEGITEKKFSANEIIQNCNTCNAIGIIVKGKAVIRSNADGVIINKLYKNDVYGVAALFDKPTYSTVVQAVTDCTILTISREFVEKCINDNKVVSINYIEFLAKKISFLNNKISAFTAKSAENKLYSYLLQLPRCENVLKLNVDMVTIAKMIGIGRATLYRAFEKLENSGTITKKDKTIIFNEV